MIYKIMASVAMASVVSVAIYNEIINARQNEQIAKFMAIGKRFTAQDGQALCERVQELERRSYGYQDAGKVLLPCDYATKK